MRAAVSLGDKSDSRGGCSAGSVRGLGMVKEVVTNENSLVLNLFKGV